jgi:preprotein translocase subunit SecA
VRLTEEGRQFIRSLPEGRDLSSRSNRPLARRIENALAVDLVVRKDVDYIREDGRIVIVDKHGQPLEGRRWSDGLHEAVEFAEGGPSMVGSPTRVLDSMTIAEFLGDRPFAGMTGTAGGVEGRTSFGRLYGTDVVEIQPRVRNGTASTVTYRTAREKWDGVFADVVDMIHSGRPILVVAGSVLDAIRFSARLRAAGIDHNLLTAKTSAVLEDRYIGQAGRRGQITVATNRVGRGIDIRLGGEVERIAREIVHSRYPGLEARDPARYRTLLDTARTEAG